MLTLVVYKFEIFKTCLLQKNQLNLQERFTKKQFNYDKYSFLQWYRFSF